MTTELNPAQRQAVLTLSGPLLVLAGAGTGKTRVVTYRIAELIRRGTEPQRILGVTFTNRAAAEMQQRVRDLLGRKTNQSPLISTFHSYCVRILRRHAIRLGFPERFAIYDRGDQESIARSVLREIRVPGELLRPGELLGHIGRWKNRSVRPRQASAEARTDKEHLAAMAYRRYQNELKNAAAVDFDDLLLYSEQLLEDFPAIRRREAALLDHLLIDEYQDTNASQYNIVKALARDHKNLCVVGDDDQSIYGWRGAQIEHILHFTREWPGATVVRLEQNYRSTAAILAAANQLIAYNKHRHEKTLQAARPGGDSPKIRQFRDEVDEARSVVEEIRRQLAEPGIDPRDFAILFRTNEQPRAFETELRRAKLPYVLVGGMSFFDRKEVREILAYLKTIESPKDEPALLRIINTPPRGIGESSVRVLLDEAVSRGRPVWDVIADPAIGQKLPESAQRGLAGFVELIMAFRRQQEQKPAVLADLLQDFIARIEYHAHLCRQYSDPTEQQSRWSAVEEIVNAIAGYQQRTAQPSLRGFLDEFALSGREQDSDKEKQLARNAIALMTLHSAKGLEFPFVYMVGMEEGLLPHRRSVAENPDDVAEERRLCYVGLTRAQHRLTLSLALTRMKWGKPRESTPSRFLFEIMGQSDNPHARKSPVRARPRRFA